MSGSTAGTRDPRSARVAIIGSGFSGISAGVELRRKGIDDFVIFEQSDGVGGTWWKNRYPGAEVDLESHIYSFSFERNDWTRTHAGWAELQAYLERTAASWGLLDHLRLNEKVEEVIWSEERGEYSVLTASGADNGTFTAVISAVGFLNIPLVPPFARGETEYRGDLCHTSTWPEGLTLEGKRVAVVGTGSSGVQIVQEAVKQAREVRIFQLEPNWLLPKGGRDFTPRERRLNRWAPVYLWRRWRLYLDYDVRQWHAQHARTDGRANRLRRKASQEFLHTSLAGRPDLIELCTPAFPFEARRTVTSDTYYPALLDPKVTLVPHGVKELTATGVVDANGDEYEADLVVLATGFDAANYLGNFRVRGERGADLHQVWKGEPEAFLGMLVPGFPNFFMMYGPNTNSIPLVTFYEAQAKFAASLIRRCERRGGQARVRRSAFLIYNDWVQERLRRTVWASTENYFQAGSGKVVSQWPAGPTFYVLATRLLRRLAVRIR